MHESACGAARQGLGAWGEILRDLRVVGGARPQDSANDVGDGTPEPQRIAIFGPSSEIVHVRGAFALQTPGVETRELRYGGHRPSHVPRLMTSVAHRAALRRRCVPAARRGGARTRDEHDPRRAPLRRSKQPLLPPLWSLPPTGPRGSPRSSSSSKATPFRSRSASTARSCIGIGTGFRVGPRPMKNCCSRWRCSTRSAPITASRRAPRPHAFADARCAGTFGSSGAETPRPAPASSARWLAA